MASTENKKPSDVPRKRTSKTKTVLPEEIYNGFQQLRNEQRNLVNKLSEVEMDINEHRMVIETIKDLDGDRKCFRQIGGVLCEKTVKDVLPTLIKNRDQLVSLAENLNDQVTKKGEKINEYKEKYKIGVRGADEPSEAPVPADSEEKSGEAGPMRVMAVDI